MQDEPIKTEPPKRKRGWFQFSLRTLFVVVAIVAVQCAVCLPMLRECEMQQVIDEIVREIERNSIKLQWTGAVPPGFPNPSGGNSISQNETLDRP